MEILWAVLGILGFVFILLAAFWVEQWRNDKRAEQERKAEKAKSIK